MGLAVGAHEAGPVDGEHHVQAQNGHVVDQHVEGALEEGGIDRHHGDHALLGKARGHADRVALGNAHIAEALGMGLGKGIQARAALHGGCDGANAAVFVRQLRKGLAEGVGKGPARGGKGLAGDGIEGPDAVEPVGVLLRRGVALALLCDDVQQHRAVHLLGLPQQVGDPGQIVAIHRPEILEAHVVEHVRADEPALEPFLEAVDAAVEGAAHRVAPGHGAPGALDAVVALAGADVGQVLGHAAHVGGDGHAVVVEDDDELLPADAGVVQALIGKAAGERAVAHQDHNVVVLPLQGPGPGHAQTHGNRV